MWYLAADAFVPFEMVQNVVQAQCWVVRRVLTVSPATPGAHSDMNFWRAAMHRCA